MESEFGRRLRVALADVGDKSLAIAGGAAFGPAWPVVEPFAKLAVSTFAAPPSDRAIAALLADWEESAKQQEQIDAMLVQLEDGIMRGLKGQFAALDALDIERRGRREALSRQSVAASLAGFYLRLSLPLALRYLRILGLSEPLLGMVQDEEFLSLIRDGLSCQVHPLARFAFEIGFCSVQAVYDPDMARINLKLQARWVGLESIVEPLLRDLQPFLDARDQDALLEFVKDFCAALAMYAGAASAT